MSESVCGAIVSSRRGLLAFLWSCVNILTFIAFVTALLFSIYSSGEIDNDAYNDQYYYNNNNNNNGEGEGGSQDEQKEQEEYNYEDRAVEVAVTSRAMAFAALWTAVLASLMAVFGTVVLGFQSPTGDYYTCCDANVHRTTPLGLGSFIGSLLMFANLTLVCSVLFGEFEIRDYTPYDGDNENKDGEQEQKENTNVQRSSMAFSIMCMFLTVLYAGFAALTYASASSIIRESEEDVSDYPASNSNAALYSHNGYIDGRFDVMPQTKKSSNSNSFRAPPPVPERQTHLLPSNADFVGANTPLSMTDSNDSSGRYGQVNAGYVEPNPLFESSNNRFVNEPPSHYETLRGGGGRDSSPPRYVEPNQMFEGGGGTDSRYAEPNPFDSRGQSIT